MHFTRESELVVLVATEVAHCDELIDVPNAVVHQIRPPPELGRTMIVKLTAYAFRRNAYFLLVSPQDVRWTDKPVLVRRVYAQGVAAESKHSGATDQRRVVEINDVEAAIEELRESTTLKQGSSGLLHDQRRSHSPSALERNDVHSVVGNAFRRHR